MVHNFKKQDFTTEALMIDLKKGFPSALGQIMTFENKCKDILSLYLEKTVFVKNVIIQTLQHRHLGK